MPPERETSIRRAVEVLLSLGSDEATAAGGMGVTRISERLGREKSQVSRALKALAEYGLVERNHDAATYRLGWRIYALAERAGHPRVVQEAAPRLRRLTRQTQERAHLSVLQGAGVLTLLSESPGRMVEAGGWVGRVSPAHCSSAGQALLFDHDRAELELAFAGADLRPQGPASATDLDDLAARIEQGRNQGFAHCEGEFEEGLTSIAAPVRDGGGAIVAAVNVSAPAFRVSGRIDEIVAAVCAAASDVSQALAARGGEAAAATASTI